MSNHDAVSTATILSSESTSEPTTTGDTGTAPAVQVAGYRAAYERRLGELSAIPLDELLPITLDIPTVTTLALGVRPALRQLREEVVRVFKDFDLTSYDAIEDYTQALFYADSVFAMVSKPMENLAPLFAQAAALYPTILQDARALGQRRYLDKEKLSEFKDSLNAYSYRNGATALFRLVTLLRGAWAKISSKTAIQLAELTEAEAIATQILDAIGEREKHEISVAEASLRRQQAFTRFVQVYDVARQAASHLRWQKGDADLFVPSLYSGRGNSNHRPATPAKPPASATPATEVPAPANPVAPGEPVAPVVPTTHAAPLVPGGPGGSPFIR